MNQRPQQKGKYKPETAHKGFFKVLYTFSLVPNV